VASKHSAKEQVTPGIEKFLGEHLALLKRDFGFSGYERNRLYWNRGDGRFVDISGIGGADHIGDGRAAVFFDYDDDGDLDLFVRAMHGPANLLYRNEVGHKSNHLRVVLTGTRSGRDAFGAVVRVRMGKKILSKIKSGGCGFVSQHDPRLLFGLGAAARVDWIEVFWPSGRRQRIDGAKANTTVRIAER